MSTRQERREWQEFRDKNGANIKQFAKKWESMFGRPPNALEILSYTDKRTELTANLGRKAKREVVDFIPKSGEVTVTREFAWDMAHRIPDHGGKCRRLHGHRYVAEIDITGPIQTKSGSSQGMVVDFGDMDKHIDEAIGRWDHRTMLFGGDPILQELKESCSLDDYGIFTMPFVPTAENICCEIRYRLRNAGLNVTRVRVYETPRSWAEVK